MRLQWQRCPGGFNQVRKGLDAGSWSQQREMMKIRQGWGRRGRCWLRVVLEKGRRRWVQSLGGGIGLVSSCFVTRNRKGWVPVQGHLYLGKGGLGAELRGLEL